jgi:hypothetical protein
MLNLLPFTCIVLLVGAVLDLAKRLRSAVILEEDKTKIRQVILSVVLLGTATIALLGMNIYSWNRSDVWFAALGTAIAFLVVWLFAPTEDSAKYRQNVERIKAELKKYSLSKKIIVGTHIIAFSANPKAVIVVDKSEAKNTIIGNSEILSCDVFENKPVVDDPSVRRVVIGGLLAGWIGAAIGLVTSKAEVRKEFTLKITTTDRAKPIHIIPVDSMEKAWEVHHIITREYMTET